MSSPMNTETKEKEIGLKLDNFLGTVNSTIATPLQQFVERNQNKRFKGEETLISWLEKKVKQYIESLQNSSPDHKSSNYQSSKFNSVLKFAQDGRYEEQQECILRFVLGPCTDKLAMFDICLYNDRDCNVDQNIQNILSENGFEVELSYAYKCDLKHFIYTSLSFRTKD